MVIKIIPAKHQLNNIFIVSMLACCLSFVVLSKSVALEEAARVLLFDPRPKTCYPITNEL